MDEAKRLSILNETLKKGHGLCVTANGAGCSGGLRNKSGVYNSGVYLRNCEESLGNVNGQEIIGICESTSARPNSYLSSSSCPNITSSKRLEDGETVPEDASVDTFWGRLPSANYRQTCASRVAFTSIDQVKES